MNVTAVQSKGTYSITLNGKMYVVNPRHKNYDKIVAALKDGKSEDLDQLLNIVTQVKNFSKKHITIKDGVLLFKGTAINNALTDKILSMIQVGMDAGPLLTFMHNVMMNPSKFAQDELYLWLDTNKMPITPDGCFLAFKNITADYKDVYTRRLDNSVGKTVFMKRDRVDPNRNKTCSDGLHFCAKEYLSSFAGEKTVVLKINPRDVVAIPSDYRNQKGRCCRYEVVCELPDYGEVAAAKFEEDAQPVMDVGSVYNKILNKYRLPKGSNPLQHLRAYLNNFLIKNGVKPISFVKLGKAINVSDKTAKRIEGNMNHPKMEEALEQVKNLAEHAFNSK